MVCWNHKKSISYQEWYSTSRTESDDDAFRGYPCLGRNYGSLYHVMTTRIMDRRDLYVKSLRCCSRKPDSYPEMPFYSILLVRTYDY